MIRSRISIDIFKSDVGKFASDLIKNLAQGNIMQGISDSIATLLNKLMGATSGAAQSERIYEVTFDELGGLNRLDAFLFCYRFASSGVTEFTKGVIGTCIVHSAALMVDDNTYRVILTSSATLVAANRAEIGDHMIEAAKAQKSTRDEKGALTPAEPGVLEARTELAKVIGESVATSEQYLERKKKPTFKSANHDIGAEKQAGDIATKT